MKQWEKDAKEFGDHVRMGGWRLGLLVARNVEPGTGGRRLETGARAPVSGKVSATDFGEKAGTHRDRVMRHLRAWNNAAADRHVPPSADLEPGVEPAIKWDALPDWEDYYPPVTGGPNGSKNRPAVKLSDDQLEEQIRERPALAAKVIADDPIAARAVAVNAQAAENVQHEYAATSIGVDTRKTKEERDKERYDGIGLSGSMMEAMKADQRARDAIGDLKRIGEAANERDARLIAEKLDDIEAKAANVAALLRSVHANA